MAGVLMAALLAGQHFLRPTVLRETARLTHPEVKDWSEARPGDYNGDGETDVFVAASGQVFVTSAQGEFLIRWLMPNFSGDDFRLGMLADLDGDDADEIFLSWRDSLTNLNIGVLNQNFHETDHFQMTGSLAQTPLGPAGDSALVPFAVQDLHHDGRRQSLAMLITHRARKPRGVCCFEMETQEPIWTNLTAPSVTEPVLVDLNGNGLLDIVFGSQAVRNGNELNDGTDDSHSYLYAVSGDGTSLWTNETGGEFTACTPILADASSKGAGVVFASVRTSPEFSKEAAVILKYDPAGKFLARYEPRAPLCPGATTRLADDGALQVLATDRSGRLYVLNSALQVVRIVPLVSQRYHGTNDFVHLVLDTVTDLDGDGQQEWVFHSTQVQTHSEPYPGRSEDPSTFRSYHDNQVLVLDSKLKPLANCMVADLYKGGTMTAVLPVNLGPRGRRGLLVLGQEAIVLELVRTWRKYTDSVRREAIPIYERA